MIFRAGLGAALFFIFALDLSAQGLFSWARRKQEGPIGAASHRGPVMALAYDRTGRTLVSGGADGYIGIWNLETKSAESRFQVSPHGLTALALRPGKTEVAVVESDGFGLYRISAWDYGDGRKLFTLRFRDPVTFLSYSASGSFLIAGRSARNGVVFIDPETGSLRQAPSEALGPVGFVATGRSERTMILYSPQGQLSYWDLEKNTEIRSLSVPANLADPRLAVNSRFLVGLEAGSLVVVDALTGNLLGRLAAATSALLLGPADDSGDLALIEGAPSEYRLAKVRISTAGIPRREADGPVFLTGNVRAALSLGSIYAVALEGGGISLVDGFGSSEALRSRRLVPIRESAFAGESLALLCEDFAVRIPADPSSLKAGDPMDVYNVQGYDHVTGERADGNAFLLWSSEGSAPPLLWTEDSFQPVAAMPSGIPYRSVSSHGGRFLAIDAAGRLTVFRPDAAEADFVFSSLGLLDAAFIDARRILLGRSAYLSAGPFLVVDSSTGETVPGEYPARAAVRLYRGESGSLYAAVVVQDGESAKTSILRLDIDHFRSSLPLVEYQGEDVAVQLAEQDLADETKSLATTLGGDGAGVFNSAGYTPFERTESLPRRIAAAGVDFVVVDNDGAAVWHDPLTGEAKAILRLLPETWELERSDGSSARGPLRLRGFFSRGTD